MSVFYLWFSPVCVVGCGWIAIAQDNVLAGFVCGAHFMITAIEWIRFLTRRAAEKARREPTPSETGERR
jgi:hypothetical protein